MQVDAEQVCKSVLEKVTPKRDERDKIETLAKHLERKVAEAAAASGLEVIVRVEGSVAKDTWLSGEPDVDVFMRVPASIPRKSLGDVGLKVARKATEGSKQVERFAEHPYLEAFVEGTRVNIVPCYNVKQGKWLSATDRTPFHTDYMKKHFNEHMKGEVRLLKKFMKGTGVYGAEIKIGGFSGYLSELLIFHYKSFLKTLETFARFRQRMIIDIEDYYRGRENELDLLFDEPLVVVDPVDKARNVASAVQRQKLFTFIAATRTFLKNPDFKFFYPPETEALDVGEVEKRLASRGSALIFVTFTGVDAVPDVLWGQLYKSQRSLRKLLEMNDFKVLRDVPWSDEKALNLFLFEVEQRHISPVKKHLGPPLEKESESENFVEKYAANSNVVAGPYIEDGRWIVEIRRKYTDVADLLSDRLRDGGRNAGVAEQISHVLRNGGFKILVNDEIVELYEKNDELAKFLTEFLQGKPRWLTHHLPLKGNR